MAASPKYIVIGIDPQPECIAYHVRDTRAYLYTSIDWNVVALEKKGRFKTSQLWQTYIYEQVKELLENMKRQHGQNIALVVCEQQKGRVNSIIENAILIVLLSLDIPVKIMAPMTWKRLTNTPNTGTHYQNKKVVVEIVGPSLEIWKKTNQINTKFSTTRLHDLCDAERLSLAGENMLATKEPIIESKSQEEESEEEIDS